MWVGVRACASMHVYINNKRSAVLSRILNPILMLVADNAHIEAEFDDMHASPYFMFRPKCDC
jgi:hypothetical protein